ncbi:hypothetical protein RSOLAG22IIIB_01818 [Rhizoctonia solani]|uniref:Uncharacterized protein n=1 Tax=Rhizoctonia solani TaxID=456999 RepID=A0A0K6G9L6_9AGAM|nr:unnamed protein product [Rhizoctonia solani]CUA75170.1 hypothetical protein RSOLAG22IIIB_01818 [Rhizoctonia solani]
MSCYINITPSDLFEATPSGKSAHTRSLDGLVSWLLTTTITILGSNHTESPTAIDAPPNHFSSDVLLAASAPLAYQLLPTWLTSPKGAICLQDI